MVTAPEPAPTPRPVPAVAPTPAAVVAETPRAAPALAAPAVSSPEKPVEKEAGKPAEAPKELKERVYYHMALYLREQPDAQHAHLAPGERVAIRSILKDTMTDLPAWWR